MRVLAQRLAPTLIIALITIGCATKPNEDVLAYHESEKTLPEIPAEGDGFETPPAMDPVAVLPEAEGNEAYFQGQAVSDGRDYHFLMEGGNATFHATGKDAARQRLHEIEVVEYLAEQPAKERAALAIKTDGKDLLMKPLRRVGSALQNPLYLVNALPTEIFWVIGTGGRAAQLIRDGFSGNSFNRFIGFDSAKRDLAGHLDVDLGTTNLALQDAVHDGAKAYFAGGLVPSAADRAIPEAPIPSVDIGDGGVSIGRGMDFVLDLLFKPGNGTRLRRMDVERETRRALSRNPWIPGSVVSAASRSLYDTDDIEQRAVFFESMATASHEDIARGWYRTAEMIRVVDEWVVPVAEILSAGEDGLVLAKGEDGSLLVFLDADEVFWTAANADAFETALAETGADADAHLFLVGGASDLAAESLADLGYTPHYRAIPTYDRPEADEHWYYLDDRIKRSSSHRHRHMTGRPSGIVTR